MHRQGSEWTVIPAKMYDITVFTSSVVEIISEQLHIKWAFPNHFLQLFDSYAPETQICHRPQRFSDKSITLFLQALPSPGPETLPSKVTATPHTIRCNPLICQIPLLLIMKCASTLPPLWHSNQVGFMPLTDLELTLYCFRSHSVDFMSLRSPQRHLLSSASGVNTLRSVPCTVPQPL